MRQLLQPRHLRPALVAGPLSALACWPYLHGARVPLAYFLALLPLMTLFWLCFLAWAPPEIRQRSRHPLALAPPRAWPLLTSLTLLGALADLALFDALSRRLVGYRPPADLPEFAAALLWVSTFQVLFLVAVPYAFAWRLCPRHGVALAFLVAFAQLVTWLRFHPQLAAPWLALLVLASGLRHLYFGLCLRYLGLTGLAFLVALGYSHYLIPLLANPR